MYSYKKSFNDLKLKPNNSIGIVGSSLCACFLGEYIRKSFKAKVVFYDKSHRIGGAWQADNKGNLLSNIIYPLSNDEKKIFLKFRKFLKKEKIEFKKDEFKSYYSNYFVKSNYINFTKFYNRVKKKNKFRYLKVKMITEINQNVFINNKFKHDYVFFPNYVDLKKITKSSSPIFSFKFPKPTNIKSHHIRIFFKKKIKDKFKNLSNNEMKSTFLDRLQIAQINKKLFKLSGRISMQYKATSKSFLVNRVTKLFNIKDVIKTHLYFYEHKYFKKSVIKKINLTTNNFNRIIHFDTSSVLGFFNKYPFIISK